MLRTTRHNLGYGGRGYRFRIGDLGFWICCFKPTSVTCFIKMAIQGHFHYLSLLQVMGWENVKCLTICHSEKCHIYVPVRNYSLPGFDRGIILTATEICGNILIL